MKNATKTLLTLTLSLVLVLSLACIAWAATPATSVKIGAVELNSSTLPTYYKNDGTAGSEESYNAKLWVDAENNNALTLTLNNANIDISGHGIYADGDLTIVLVGENTITGTNGNGIRVTDDSHVANNTIALTITGGGTLNARSNDSATSGIYTRKLTITSGTVNATSQWEAGIKTDNTLTISGGIVNATGYNGLYANKISISGGTVNATGVVMGIHADSNGTIDSGTVTISGGTVNATGNDGLYANKISISGGTVTATGSGANGYGIYAQESNFNGGDIKISNGTVTAEGGKGGMYADNKATIDGGNVTANAADNGGVGIGAKNEVTIGTNEGTTSPTVEVSGGTGLYTKDVFLLENSKLTITAEEKAIDCTNLYFDADTTKVNHWYKWKADSNSIQTSSDTNHLSTETLAGVKKLVIAKEISEPTPNIPYYPVVTPTTPDEGDKVTAAETLDGGIALSVAMTILTATGSAWLAKKKD